MEAVSVPGAAVVLAAGRASRMGSPKALLDAGGRPLIRAICDALRGVGPVFVVVGHHREAIEAVLEEATAVENPAPDRGQVSSMAVGLRAAARAGHRWALVALVDQPPVRPATIELLAEAARAAPDAVHVPVFQGERGHPAAFPTALGAGLESAGPGEGARDVIGRLGVEVREHAVDDPGVLVDLDTPDDVARWRATAPAPGDGDLFAEAARRWSRREPYVLCTVVATERSAPRDAGAKMLVAPDGSIAGTVGGGPLEASVIFEAVRILRERGGAAVFHFALSAAGDKAEVRRGSYESMALGMKCGGEVAVFLDAVRPPARLIVYGAGHVGERVATIATEAGFHCAVVDDRAAFVTRARLPRVAELRCRDLAKEPLGGLDPGPDDFIVIVTRCHELDEGVLEAALATPARYVGLIGSRRKVAVVLRNIERRTGRDARLDARLHAPIGLKLGGKAPAEIAVSILAEVLLVKSEGALEHNRLPLRQAERQGA